MTLAPAQINKQQADALLQQALEAESLIDQEIARLNSMKTEDYELLKEKRCAPTMLVNSL